MKLYELAEEYRDFESKLDLFLEMIEQGEMDEQTFDDTLAMIETSLEDKIDAVACTIKNMESEAEAMRAEELRLAKRRKARENAAERLRAYLSNTMTSLGKTKVETPRNRLSFLRNAKVEIVDESSFLAFAKSGRIDLLTFSEPAPNQKALKRALDAGEEIPGAVMTVRANLQIK